MVSLRLRQITTWLPNIVRVPMGSGPYPATHCRWGVRRAGLGWGWGGAGWGGVGWGGAGWGGEGGLTFKTAGSGAEVPDFV